SVLPTFGAPKIGVRSCRSEHECHSQLAARQEPRPPENRPAPENLLILTDTRSLPRADMLIREIHEDLPILPRHRVLPRADIVAKATVDKYLRRWQFFCPNTFDTQKSIHRIGCDEHRKLSVWIRPRILNGVCKEDRSWGAKCHQTM